MRRWFEQMATLSLAAWKSRRWAACLWPGVPQLWLDGSWRGLACAAAFAVAINGLLAVSLVWYELAAPAAKGACWLLLIATWLAAAAVSWRWLARRDCRSIGEIRTAAVEDLYPAAVNEYLKRNFVAAERQLLKLLSTNERDCAAGFLLSAVWRRTGRIADARGELMRLSRLEAARSWAMEIERELKLLDATDRTENDGELADETNESKAA
ncbi:MAG: hypothetical protein WD875_19525 [Pirellulales bacterium]